MELLTGACVETVRGFHTQRPTLADKRALVVPDTCFTPSGLHLRHVFTVISLYYVLFVSDERDDFSGALKVAVVLRNCSVLCGPYVKIYSCNSGTCISRLDP